MCSKVKHTNYVQLIYSLEPRCLGLRYKVAVTEPLNADGSPHIAKLEKVVQLKMEDKVVE